MDCASAGYDFKGSEEVCRWMLVQSPLQEVFFSSPAIFVWTWIKKLQDSSVFSKPNKQGTKTDMNVEHSIF